jgi:serine/threonine-protein kinase pkaA
VASVDVVVSLPLPATGTQAALEQWLRGAQTATQAALADPHVVSTSYPVQRLAGVDVVVASQVVTGSPLTVTLLPVWPSGADAVHPLYVSPSAGAPSTLLTAVAGGASGVSFADGCAGALVVSADGLNVVTVGAAPQCVVRARVGNLGDLVSNTFAVVGHGS